MSKIALVHPDFSFTRIGGEEVICMNILEALQNDHELTLFSFTPPDLADLNEFANTDVDIENITFSSPDFWRQLPAVVSFANRLSGSRLGLQRPLLVAAFNRAMHRREDEFDYLISTSNEMSFTTPSLQYIHFPRYNLACLDREIGVSGTISTAYDRFCAGVAGLDTDALCDVTLLTNSEWTAGVIDAIYGVHPEVLYPPIDTDAFANGQPWEKRESGFISIGRLTPAKNVLNNVEIVRRLRDRGYDVHLHLVGPTATDHEDYRRTLQERSDAYDFVHLEGRIPRQAMVELICSHRYGLHGKKYEHFGIAVAELVAGGALPFVPDNSGQREVVGEQTALLYDGIDDAVDKITRVLDDPERQQTLQTGLPDPGATFGQKRFQQRIRDLVAADVESNSRQSGV